MSPSFPLMKKPRTSRWSDPNTDILGKIFSRLDADDFIRSRAVCVSWRSIPKKTLKKDVWLLNPSTPADGKPGSKYVYSLNNLLTKQQEEEKLMVEFLTRRIYKDEFALKSNSNVEFTKEQPCQKPVAKYTVNLPRTAGFIYFFGSSQGFLIILDLSDGEFLAINPLSRAILPLPSMGTHPDVIYRNSRGRALLPSQIPRHMKATIEFQKAVISPSLDTTVIASEASSKGKRSFCNLVFARAGDISWAALLPPPSIENKVVSDVIFHNSLLYVLYHGTSLVVFDLVNPSARYLITTHPLPTSNNITIPFLVETPDEADLLLLWKTEMSHISIDDPAEFKVFKLEKRKREWNQVKTIGETALFLGGVRLFSLSTKEISYLQKNCIYFTVKGHVRVFNLEDGSMEPFIGASELQQMHSASSLWFTPSL